MQNSVPSPLLLLLPLGFSVIVCTLLRYVSGWAALARVYRARQAFTGPTKTFQSATLSYGMAFNNCLVLGADQKGLSISVFFPLTLAFPPLFIPWADITATPKQGLFLPVIDFRFAQAPAVRFSVVERLGRDLLASRPASAIQPQRVPRNGVE